MKHWKRLIVAGAVTMSGGVAATHTASAGVDDGRMTTVDLSVWVTGTEAPNVGDWLPELYIGDSAEAADCDTMRIEHFSPLEAVVDLECAVFDDGDGEVDVVVGYATPPETYEAEPWCMDFGQNPGGAPPAERLENTSPTYTVDQWSDLYCSIDIRSAVVLIDKAFEPHTIERYPGSTVPTDPPPATDPIGGAAPGDFTFELYDDQGQLYGGTAVDVAPEYCDFDHIRGNDQNGSTGLPCAALDVAPGTYTLGEVTTFGYRAIAIECGYVSGGPEEDLGDAFEGAEFTIREYSERFHCQVENEYVESPVTVSVDIANDHGGTATPSDFTMELYRADDLGAPVATGVCDDTTKVCIDDDFPIGDYVVGQIGPDGYAVVQVNQTVTPLLTEALSETNAAFTLDVGNSVAVEVVNDDVEPTTTTTMAPTTTVAATTTAAATTTVAAAITTTTAFDSAGITLPKTGNGQQSTLALAALLLLLLGGGAIALARRQH